VSDEMTAEEAEAFQRGNAEDYAKEREVLVALAKFDVPPARVGKCKEMANVTQRKNKDGSVTIEIECPAYSDTAAPRKPDLKSDGVAVWGNVSKNGDGYLNIIVAGHNKVPAFIPREEPAR